MDENKLDKLREIGYNIVQCCGNCIFYKGGFKYAWSTCNKHKYDHKKHTESDRDLSVNQYGSCNDHIFRADYITDLDTWKQFV